MAETKELCMPMEPAFQLSEADLVKTCRSRASTNNEWAMRLKQEPRITAAELEELYYAQGGRCAISGWPLLLVPGNSAHPFSIQLDHIIDVLRRSSWTSIADGGESVGGMAADIKNVQWVCKAAHALKTHCASSGLNLRDMCISLGEQAAAGFPIRSSECADTPKRSRLTRRHEVLEKLYAEHGDYLWIMDVMYALNGTDMEVGEHVVRQELKALGWVGRSALTKRRVEIVRSVCSKQFPSMTDAWRECLPKLEAEELSLTFPGFRSLVKQQRIAVDVSEDRIRSKRISSGDRIAAVNSAKASGDAGITRQSLLNAVVSKGATTDAAERCIDGLLFDGLLYADSQQNTIVASLTRKEVADVIGKSRNRLKKWGSSAFADEPAGPAFFKASPKGKTYYRRDDVAQWLATNHRHPLDLCVAGQRESCVEGGKLGGRPLFSDAV